MIQGSGNVNTALELLKSQRGLLENLQLQNGHLINGPDRPSRISRNPALDQHTAQPANPVVDNVVLGQIRSESPDVINCNGTSNNFHVTENNNSQAPPALPPRSCQKEPPPRGPAHPSTSIASVVANTEAQQTTTGNNCHPMVGRKYSPNGASTAITQSANNQNSDAPPLPPPRGASNPPPTPPPLRPRGTTPPPSMVATGNTSTQHISNHQGGKIYK